jgi:hypothetical protein
VGSIAFGSTAESILDRDLDLEADKLTLGVLAAARIERVCEQERGSKSLPRHRPQKTWPRPRQALIGEQDTSRPTGYVVTKTSCRACCRELSGRDEGIRA